MKPAISLTYLAVSYVSNSNMRICKLLVLMPLLASKESLCMAIKPGIIYLQLDALESGMRMAKASNQPDNRELSGAFLRP